MLAYVFWHHPREGVDVEAYERAQVEFHRSLSENSPTGFGGSACYRAADVPWLAEAEAYEDWYFVESYTALGLLNDAAVDQRHRGPHDESAKRFGGGAGGLYGLIEGTGRDAASVSWVARRPGLPRLTLEQMLGEGSEQRQASLWRRQFVFGPAPEYCLLGPVDAAGASPDRLPEGWSSLSVAREQLAV